MAYILGFTSYSILENKHNIIECGPQIVFKCGIYCIVTYGQT